MWSAANWGCKADGLDRLDVLVWIYKSQVRGWGRLMAEMRTLNNMEIINVLLYAISKQATVGR